MRIINQVLAALMKAIGLRKAGKYSEAMGMIEQAIQQLTGLSSSLFDQLEDESALSILTNNGSLDTERTLILADLYQEEGEIAFEMGQADMGFFAWTRALRFMLEAALAVEGSLTTECMRKIGTLVQTIKDHPLPIVTLLGLSDYYQRLLAMDDRALSAGYISREQIGKALAILQQQIDDSMNAEGI